MTGQGRRLGEAVWTSCRHLRRPCIANRRTLTSDGRRLVLGIESSCDDSCAALVSAPPDYPSVRDAHHRAETHCSIVLKQDHSATRGIEPLSAGNNHTTKLPLAIVEALRQGQQKGILRDANQPHEIDAIAVTQGPGMGGCLNCGLNQANLLGTLWHRPLLYVHHMVAHALTPLMTSAVDGTEGVIRFPFLVFLLSGGHTQLVLCRSLTHFRILATSDEAIGRVFDKAARELCIPFDWQQTAPGAALEQFARQHTPYAGEANNDQVRAAMSIPLVGFPAFSYSGIRHSLSMFHQNVIAHLPTEQAKLATRRAAASHFQRAAFAQIQDKLDMALSLTRKRRKAASSDGVELVPALLPDDICPSDICDVVLSGGVASNAALRACIQETLTKIGRNELRAHFPPVALCTDNAAMIAHAGLLHWQPTTTLRGTPRPKWSVEDFP